jgi:ABC-type lipoprotein release transport system permease subunit
MTFKKFRRFTVQNIRRNRKNFIFSGFGIIAGVSSFIFFVALGNGIKRVVAREIFPLEANRIQVVPRLAGFDIPAGSREITAEALGRFSTIPGVAAVYPRMKLAVPATMALEGQRFPDEDLARIARLPGISPEMVESVRKLDLWMEIMADGIDPRLTKSDILFGPFQKPAAGEPIPILISRQLIEIYNASFAKARLLPPVSDILVPYVPAVTLTLNDSYVVRDLAGLKEHVRVKLVGLSHHALLGGVTMPLDVVREINRRFAGPKAAEIYDSALLEVVASDKLSSVQMAIKDLGFKIDESQKRMAESVGLAVTLVTLGFTLISLVMVGVAAVNIGHIFFMIIYERQREIGLLRALGASKRDIRSMIHGEAALVGTAGGAVGVAVGTAACILVNWIAVKLLPQFPFKPHQFFAFPVWIFAGGIALAVAFCLVGAFAPANRAARLDPASVLSGRG